MKDFSFVCKLCLKQCIDQGNCALRLKLCTRKCAHFVMSVLPVCACWQYFCCLRLNSKRALRTSTRKLTRMNTNQWISSSIHPRSTGQLVTSGFRFQTMKKKDVRSISTLKSFLCESINEKLVPLCTGNIFLTSCLIGDPIFQEKRWTIMAFSFTPIKCRVDLCIICLISVRFHNWDQYTCVERTEPPLETLVCFVPRLRWTIPKHTRSVQLHNSATLHWTSAEENMQIFW